MSIGIALYPDDGEEGEILIKIADKAKYLAKKEGPNNYHWAGFKLTQQKTVQVFSKFLKEPF